MLVMTTREKLHRLVDELAEAELAPTLRLVETQRHDPMLQALADAPEDDEPWTDEDEAAVAEGRADLAAGRTISLDEMLRKHG
jgi:predicted transcriptional regulator